MRFWFALLLGCSSKKDVGSEPVDTDPLAAVDDTGGGGGEGTVDDTGEGADDTADGVDDTGGGPDDTGGEEIPFEPGDYDGTYVGSFVLEVTGVSLPVSDTCTGEVTFTALAGEIEGGGDCTFTADGIAASLGVAGPWAGEVRGFMFAADDVQGGISIDILGDEYTEAWTGVFDGPELSATFVGTITYEGLEFSYEGSFTGSPE